MCLGLKRGLNGFRWNDQILVFKRSQRQSVKWVEWTRLELNPDSSIRRLFAVFAAKNSDRRGMVAAEMERNLNCREGRDVISGIL